MSAVRSLPRNPDSSRSQGSCHLAAPEPAGDAWSARYCQGSARTDSEHVAGKPYPGIMWELSSGGRGRCRACWLPEGARAAGTMSMPHARSAPLLAPRAARLPLRRTDPGPRARADARPQAASPPSRLALRRRRGAAQGAWRLLRGRHTPRALGPTRAYPHKPQRLRSAFGCVYARTHASPGGAEIFEAKSAGAEELRKKAARRCTARGSIKMRGPA